MLFDGNAVVHTQLSIDASWLQAKSEAQKKQFVILSNKIDRALRAVKPSNDLRFQLAQAFSDAGAWWLQELPCISLLCVVFNKMHIQWAVVLCS